MIHSGHKVIIIGDSNVGKTSLLFKFIFNQFDQDRMTTLGSSFKSKMVGFNHPLDGVRLELKLNIWDTAG